MLFLGLLAWWAASMEGGLMMRRRQFTAARRAAVHIRPSRRSTTACNACSNSGARAWPGGLRPELARRGAGQCPAPHPSTRRRWAGFDTRYWPRRRAPAASSPNHFDCAWRRASTRRPLFLRPAGPRGCTRRAAAARPRRTLDIGKEKPHAPMAGLSAARGGDSPPSATLTASSSATACGPGLCVGRGRVGLGLHTAGFARDDQQALAAHLQQLGLLGRPDCERRPAQPGWLRPGRRRPASRRGCSVSRWRLPRLATGRRGRAARAAKPASPRTGCAPEGFVAPWRQCAGRPVRLHHVAPRPCGGSSTTRTWPPSSPRDRCC